MPSTSIKRLDIAIESNYMNRPSGSATPDETGLTWTACEFSDASQVVAVGSTQTLETNASTGGFGKNPGEALVDPTTGLPVKNGSMTIDFYLRGGLQDGGVLPAGQDMLLALLWTRFAYSSEEATTTSAAVSTTAAVTLPSAASSYQFIPVTMDDGRLTYGLAGAATTSPRLLPVRSFSAGYTGTAVAPAAGGDINLTTWKIDSVGGDPIALGSRSVALRLSGDGWQQIIHGATLTAVTISCDGDGRAIKCSCTVDCPYIVDVAEADIIVPDYPTINAGPVLHSLGSPAIVYSQVGSTVPGLGGGPCMASWSINLSWQTVGTQCGSYWSGRGPLEAVGLDATVDMTIGSLPYDTISTLQTAWRTSKTLQVLIPFGGDVSADATPAPFGGGIVLPAAILANGDFTNPDLSGDAVQVSLQLNLSQMPLISGLLSPLFVMGVF